MLTEWEDWPDPMIPGNPKMGSSPHAPTAPYAAPTSIKRRRPSSTQGQAATSYSYGDGDQQECRTRLAFVDAWSQSPEASPNLGSQPEDMAACQ